MPRFLSALALTGCLVAGFSTTTWAQQSSGFTLFSGVKSENQLPFQLDYGGKSGIWDRYRLRLPAKRVKLAIAQIAISYPDYYKGEIDPKAVEIALTSGRKVLKKIPIQEVNWDRENRLILIALKEPIPASSSVEIILSNVRNPSNVGMYYFNCQIQTPGDVPLLRYIGTWIITINR
ncbi:hypothetical protein DO97_01915 [Neosynechococcus sphagnicola sy1]|uniref:DUF2808 domain-containing protein n=1 Tax=Neosynechococcus sphagnicola sy1 TaxID=1497020 RepID=A0A098TLI8_9CYAN|nr:hypothetical protein DO97_01915 [Neosynechococcus sphagnicola sy1]